MQRIETKTLSDGRSLSLSVLRASAPGETAFAVGYDGAGTDGLVCIIESADARAAYRFARSELRREVSGKPFGGRPRG